MRWRTWLLVGGGLAAFLAWGLLFPLRTGPRIPHEPTHAQNTAFNLKNAIFAFHTEYREFPLLDPANDLTTHSEQALMDILFGSDGQKAPGGRNPRGIAFYVGKAAAPIGDGRFRKGVTLDDNDGGVLWDPWGNLYSVRFDTNGDGKVENPEAPGNFLPESIAVWSAGPDGDFVTWEDNVKTW